MSGALYAADPGSIPDESNALFSNSRAAPSVGGDITAQSVQPQGEILEVGRKKGRA